MPVYTVNRDTICLTNLAVGNTVSCPQEHVLAAHQLGSQTALLKEGMWKLQSEYFLHGITPKKQ
jgi:hypothetical protein